MNQTNPLPDWKVAEIEKFILQPMKSNLTSNVAIARLLDVESWQVKLIREKLIKLGVQVPSGE